MGCGAELQSEDKHLSQCSSGAQQPRITESEGAQTSILFPYEKLRPKCKVIYGNENKRVTVFKVTLARPVDNEDDPMYGRKELVLKSTKIGPKEQRKIDNLIREYYIGRTFGCCSENVAKVLSMKSKVDQDGGRVIEILSEYGGQSLLEYKDKLEKGDVVRMMLQLVNVLALMEVVGVAHNDIKPENLVWDQTTGVLKIIDFGSSISMFQTPEALKKAADAFYARQVSGFTKYFGPPEVRQGTMDAKKYVPQKVDAFCFAMTFITMLFYEHKLNIDTLPSRGKTEEELEEYVRKVKEILVDKGEGAWIGLLCGCLDYKPSERLAFSEIKETFEAIVEMHHPEFIRPMLESKVDELKLAEAYHHMREHNVAVRFYEKALEKDCCHDEKELIDVYESLGISYACLAQFEKAKSCLNKSLSMREDIFGKDHQDVAAAHVYRGDFYRSSGKYEDAINDYLKALEIIKKTVGKICNLKTIVVCSVLGATYTSMENFDEALKYYFQAQVIGERLLKKTSPELAEIYSSLGICLMKFGRYERAGRYLEKAKEIEALINKSSHGSPEFLHLYLGLGRYYQETNKYEESKKFYSQALEMTKEKFGEEKSDVANICSELGSVYISLKEFEEAHKYHTFAIEIQRKVHGEVHPDIAEIWNQLAISYSNLGDKEHSIEFLLKALEIYKKMDITKEGNISLPIAITNGNLGKACRASNRNEDAVVYLKRALELWKDVPEHVQGSPSIAELWHELGLAYYSLGRYEEAISCTSRVINLYKETKGETHDDVADTYVELLVLQHKLNKFDDAINSGLQALKIWKTNHGKVHADIAETCLHLGANYFMTNRLELALQYFAESEEIYKQLPEFGPTHKKVAQLYSLESKTYLRLGNIDKFMELADMAKSIRG